MINPNDLREILFNISKDIILPSFGNLEKNQIPVKTYVGDIREMPFENETFSRKFFHDNAIVSFVW